MANIYKSASDLIGNTPLVEITNIENTVKNILNNANNNKARISEYKKQNVYNFGHAGKACADSYGQSCGL